VIADPCNACGGQGLQQVRKKLRINIPAGVDTGTRLRVANEGNAGQRGGPAGDLYVFLSVQSHGQLRREGINIGSEISLNYLQAILGDTIEVETVDGFEELKIPAGTQPATVLTLTGKGVPKLGNPVARGNHLFTVKVQLPTKLNAEEKELLQQLASHHTTKGQKHPHKSGLFGGLFG
jgi:molecular chaperone DnaJ